MENKLSVILEALLLSASRPISIDEMIKVFEDQKPSKEEIRSALNQIDEGCIERAIELELPIEPPESNENPQALN